METLNKWKQKLPKWEIVKEKALELKSTVMHSRQKRFYLTFGLLLSTCFMLLLIRGRNSSMLNISDADNMYGCGCPTTDGETELHQMTR